MPVEDAIVTAFTRSTSGETRLEGVLWTALLGMRVVGGRDIVRLVRVVNIGLVAMSGVWRSGMPMTLSYVEERGPTRCPLQREPTNPRNNVSFKPRLLTLLSGTLCGHVHLGMPIEVPNERPHSV